MSGRFPIYIPSKSRHDSRLTVKALQRMKIDFFIVVEKQQYNDYASVIPHENILILDTKYQDDYDTFDSLGNSKSKGPGAARNFALDHSVENGFDWHWVMDDNIRYFYYLNNNKKIHAVDDNFFKIMEDFVLRYENIAMAGPAYEMFTPRKSKQPPLILNTRIYSCNLIRNDLGYRWRGRYNEDTDISLRMLKDGWCTVQFNFCLQGKVWTQTVKGGNTEAFYSKEGTSPKSQMQVDMHPDVSKLTYRFNRVHHIVDYSKFTQKLRRKKDFIPSRYKIVT